MNKSYKIELEYYLSQIKIISTVENKRQRLKEGRCKWRYLSLLVIWEIDRKSFDKNEVENLTNFVEVKLFKVFLKLPKYKLCVSKYM